MTVQRVLRRFLQLFRLLSDRLRRVIPPMGPHISSDGSQASMVPAPSHSENRSNIGSLQTSGCDPLNHENSRSGGPSVSCVSTPIALPAATTHLHMSSLTFAVEDSQRLPKPFGATDIDRYGGKPLVKNANEMAPIIRAGRPIYDECVLFDIFGFIGNFDIDSCTLCSPDVGTSWKSCTHPEGALYFADSRRRIFTDDDVHISSNREAIDKCVVQLTDLAISMNIIFPDPNLELVLKLTSTKTKTKQFYYYFVDVNGRQLFWLSDYDQGRVFQSLRGVKEPTHIKKALETQYWCVTSKSGVWRFADQDAGIYTGSIVNCILTSERSTTLSSMNCAIQLFMQMPVRSIMSSEPSYLYMLSSEFIMSDTSLVPFESAELSKMMEIMGVLKGTETIGKPNDHLVTVLAKFMGSFSNVQFLSFHGQPEARLDTDQSIYESAEYRARTSILLRIVDYFLFGTPSTYSEEIKRVWVDELVNLPRWRAFITTMATDWAGFTIYSTVMLAVDVSLLAVPGVDPATSVFQPVSVIAIYISVICIVGSLLSSIILINQSRASARSSSGEVSEYLMNMTSSLIGTDYMAIMYSVPFGLLIWGMILFLVSFVSVIFSSRYTPTRVTVGLVIFLITIFAVCPLRAHIMKLLKWVQMIKASIRTPVGKRRRRVGRTGVGSRRQHAESSDQTRRPEESLDSVSMA
ncbi:hypothetical protein J3A83DRAFT_4412364 [Scleroderma citrinum]